MDNGHDLYLALQRLDLIKNSPENWWPNAYTFEVLIGAILTQNTQWTQVEVSLKNLQENHILSLEKLADVEIELLIECIRPSGFYKAKSKNIKMLSQNILNDFGDFDTFQLEVSREWLLAQRGIGPESADGILCFGCQRDVMVVDKYTQQLVSALGYEAESYEDLQSWCIRDFVSEHPHHDFALFHGMIVEYMKKYKKGKKIDIVLLKTLL